MVESIQIDEVEEYANDKIDLAVIVNKNASGMDFETEKPVTIISAHNSSLAGYMETIRNAQICSYGAQEPAPTETSENEVGEKGVPIRNALGMIIFKMIGTSSSLAALIIMEKKNNIRNRIYMSKTKLSVYLASRGIVFFRHLLLFAVIYFIGATIFRFDLAMEHPAHILIVFTVLVIFTTAYGLLMSAFAKDGNTVWTFGVMVLLPTSILSGMMFPFESTPKVLQTLGNLCPQRWVSRSVEILQMGGTLAEAFVPLAGVLVLSAAMFVVASLRLNKREI